MDTFNDSEYAVLIGNLLHDTQYIEISNMGKLAGLRKHAEVMVRNNDIHLEMLIYKS